MTGPVLAGALLTALEAIQGGVHFLAAGVSGHVAPRVSLPVTCASSGM
jgi:hypothetical protein